MVFLGLVGDSGQEEAEPRGMQKQSQSTGVRDPFRSGGSRPAGVGAKKVEEQQGDGKVWGGAMLHETFRGMKSGAASRTIRSLSVALPVKYPPLAA